LIEGVTELQNRQKGWYSGRYEEDESINRALTANTNGVILESIHYRRFGPLIGSYQQVAHD